MLRKLKDQLNGGKSQTLPGSYNIPSGASSKSWNPLQQRQPSNTNRDGSAAGIHTTGTLQQAWQRASVATRVTWIACLTSVLAVWWGYRFLRYHSAGILITCHSVTCEIRVNPVGWDRPVEMNNLSRHQLVTAMGIKATKDGMFVTDQGVVLTESYTGGKKKYKKKTASSYKGPDDNGHYLTYAIILADKKEDQTGDAVPPNDGEEFTPDADLKPLHRFMEEFTDGEGTTKYRLIPKRFGVRLTKRRIRTMVQKIESYIKRRRQKIVIYESAAPSWQGILLLVFGGMGFFIACFLGQFQDPVVHRGPGVRRLQQELQRIKQNKQQYPNGKRDPVREAYQPATPAQYEVSTSSSPAATVSKGTTSYRRNATQARKRMS